MEKNEHGVVLWHMFDVRHAIIHTPKHTNTHILYENCMHINIYGISMKERRNEWTTEQREKKGIPTLHAIRNCSVVAVCVLAAAVCRARFVHMHSVSLVWSHRKPLVPARLHAYAHRNTRIQTHLMHFCASCAHAHTRTTNTSVRERNSRSFGTAKCIITFL